MKFTINGQILSGKNAMQVTRTGRHYPLQRFVDWRTDVFAQLHVQVPNYEAFKGPTMALFDYFPSDLRRRDVPGMIDALFHVFERFGLIRDDSLFQDVHWEQFSVDRKNPRVEVVMEAIGGK